MSTESSCIIYIDKSGDSDVFCSVDVRNGVSSAIYSDSNAFVVLRDAINRMSDIGGKIFVCAGIYTLSNTIELKSGIFLEGESAGFGKGTVFTTGEFDATKCFSLERVDNVTLRNLAFQGIHIKENGINDTCNAISMNGSHHIKIENCYFDNCGGPAIYGGDSNDDIVTENIVITKCFISNAGLDSCRKTIEDPLLNYPGFTFHHAKNILIDGCDVRNCGSTGISVWSGSGCVKIVNCFLADNDQKMVFGQGHGIIVGGALGADEKEPNLVEPEASTEQIIISGNHCLKNGGHGIEANSFWGKKTIVSNNICIGNGHHAVGDETSEIQHRSGIYTGHYNTLVCGNQIEDNSGNGIRVGNSQNGWANTMITDNFIGNNNRGSFDGDYKYNQSGITINVGFATQDPGSIPKCIIRDNIFYNKNEEGYLQNYGIVIRNEAKGFVIEDNYFYGNITGVDWNEVREHGIVRRNTGFKTETTGTDVIVSGNISKIVTHGLDILPLSQGFYGDTSD